MSMNDPDDEPRNRQGRFTRGHSGNPEGARRDARPAGKDIHQIMDALVKRDGWASALTGIGTHGKDKRLSHQMRRARYTYDELIEMWVGDDIAARAVDTVPTECMREGHELVISDEDSYDGLKEFVESELERLQVNYFARRAHALERGLGGSVLLLGVNDGRRLDEPLGKPTSFDWIQALEPVEIFPMTFYSDPAGPKYGEPLLYQLNAISFAMGQGMFNERAAPPAATMVHESRLIVFPGIRVSKFQHVNGALGRYWGESVLVRLAEIIRDFHVAYQSAGIIVTDFSQSVMKVKNLMAIVARNPQLLADRMAAVELGRSTARAVLIDAEEEFERKSTNVAGLPDLLNALSSRLASAIDMPLTLLMGQSPKGLGNEGESDIRFYYDRIASMQRDKIRPVLRRIISLIMQAGGKKAPKKWDVRFKPLWQLTEQEISDARLTMARADALYLKTGVLHPDEVRNSRFKGEYSFETQIDESQKAPGPMLPPGHGPMPTIGPDGKPMPPPAPPAPPTGNGGRAKPGAAAAGAAGTLVGAHARRNPTRPAATVDELGIAPERRADGTWHVATLEGESLGSHATREDAEAAVAAMHDTNANTPTTTNTDDDWGTMGASVEPGLPAAHLRAPGRVQLAYENLERVAHLAGSCVPGCRYPHVPNPAPEGESMPEQDETPSDPSLVTAPTT